MPAATRDRAIRQAVAVDRRLSGQSDGQLARPRRRWPGPASRTPPGSCPARSARDRRAAFPGCRAFPLPNSAGLLRGTNEQSTTVITFLYFRPGTSFSAQTAGANAYAHWFLNRPGDHVSG
jgi:hypothetical protein